MSEGVNNDGAAPLDVKPAVKKGITSSVVVIEHNPEHNIFFDAFSAQPFRDRVEAGIQRVKRLHAESGFSIITNGSKSAFSPLELGGKHPDTTAEKAIGHKTSTGVGLDKFSLLQDSKTYRQIGDFHFHPISSAFSQPDMEAYDNPGIIFKKKPNMYHGVFIPEFEKTEIKNMQLFMFAGPAFSTEYQGEDFNRLPLVKQREILEKSGMKTMLIDFPTSGASIDFSSLTSAVNSIT